MRKTKPTSFSSYNGPSASNGNYSVTLDFSGNRPTVEIRGTGENSRWGKGKTRTQLRQAKTKR